jgi:hypothetical protein
MFDDNCQAEQREVQKLSAEFLLQHGVIVTTFPFCTLNSSRGTMPHHRANPLVPHLSTVRVTFIYDSNVMVLVECTRSPGAKWLHISGSVGIDSILHTFWSR